ncbi:MAG: DHH family phosphoesterase [Lachnospiraceae bacterium]|nr:DHH family phosphoesterase [Lachnospiraceae bacterium]MCR5428767.1 DHH family phosphoesterase [Lachnospiraceae bacterium]
MDNKRRLVPFIKSILRWALILAILLAVFTVIEYTIDRRAGICATVFLGLYMLVVLIMFLIKRKTLVLELVRFGVNYSNVQRKLDQELEIPYAILDKTGCILWSNKKLLDMVGNKIRPRQDVTTLFPELTPEVFPRDEEQANVFLECNSMHYRVLMKNLTIEGIRDDSRWGSDKLRPSEASGETLVIAYFYDETEINTLKQALKDNEIVVGLLYIDNYNEALESIDEVRRSLFAALVDRKINKYFQNYDAVIKKFEQDKYILVCQNSSLDALESSKFDILEDVRGVNIGNEMNFTVSIGIGAEAGTFSKTYESARAAIDLALGRGGDQVVIRDKDSVKYYGARTSSVEKNSKVKSRVKAHALRELLETKDKILVMGHSMPDIDAFGSAVGIYKIASSMDKEVHIVLSDVTGSIRPIVNKFEETTDYNGLIVSREEAVEMLDSGTMVVVVDVNRPSYTECPELLEKAKTVVVLDHHRQSDEAIENAALSYVEPSASSACEVISEIIQYFGENIRFKPVEADAMLAGIMVDSNNFQNKTGTRTFESAAYLRKNGADMTRIRKMFREEMNEYVARAKVVSSAQLFMDQFAFAVCDADNVDSPTVLGAQVANELMDINNIKASFVFTDYNGTIYVSARSIDEVNVQVIMEKLGGGGHMSVAGAQFTDCTVEEAMGKVKDILTEMKEGGEV